MVLYLVGRLVRVEEAGGLKYEAPIEPTSSDSLCGGPSGIGWLRRKEHMSGDGDVPPRS